MTEQLLEIPHTDTDWAGFSFVNVEDVDQLVDLGEIFFDESDFTQFTSFSRDNFEQTLKLAISQGHLRGFVLRDAGYVTGFILYQLDMTYTADPIALLYLFYVTQKHRRSIAGDRLLKLAEQDAQGMGAKAFFAGAMSGVPGTAGTLANLYKKHGFDQLFWGRKVL